MPMDAKSILVYTVYIVVLAHIDSVTIMISIGTPDEIVPPKIFILSKVIYKECIGTKNG